MTGDRSPESTLSLPSRPAGAPRDCGELGIRIGRDGTWYYQGSPIGRKPLVKLFASVLRREADGQFWMVTPAERGTVAVEDAPFTAVEVTASGRGHAQRLRFCTNLDDEVVADAEHPIRVELDPKTEEPSPYILVRDGLEARLLRPVYYELVTLGETRRVGDEEQLGVWSGGQCFLLGRLGSAR